MRFEITWTRRTYEGVDGATSPWLAGLNPKDFAGPTLGEQLAQAAHSIGAHILSVHCIQRFCVDLCI